MAVEAPTVGVGEARSHHSATDAEGGDHEIIPRRVERDLRRKRLSDNAGDKTVEVGGGRAVKLRRGLVGLERIDIGGEAGAVARGVNYIEVVVEQKTELDQARH